MNRTVRIASLVAVCSGAVGMAAGAWAAGKAREYKFTGATEIAWQPLDPKNPGGAQMAVVSGDLKKPSSLWLLKAPAGVDFPIHAHTADYNAVVVQGTWKHNADGQPGQQGGPGTYWYQPGKAMHGDGCAAGGPDCIIAISMGGKHDFIPKEAPAAEKK